ncbi:MAG: hypothetical protein ABEN55_03995 [Bradymonadaceae bacterium]
MSDVSAVSKINDYLEDPDVRIRLKREMVDITDVGSGDYVQFYGDDPIYRARWRQMESGPFVLEFTDDGDEFGPLKDVHAGVTRDCFRVTSIDIEIDDMTWTWEC